MQIIDKTLAAIQTYSTTIISGAKSEGVARTGKIEEEAMSEMLLFYSKMIILEMSHDSMKQQMVIQKGGAETLETLELFSYPRM